MGLRAGYLRPVKSSELSRHVGARIRKKIVGRIRSLNLTHQIVVRCGCIYARVFGHDVCEEIDLHTDLNYAVGYVNYSTRAGKPRRAHQGSSSRSRNM